MTRRTARREIETAAEAATERFGFSLGNRIDHGVLISLVGVLGSGKSIVARGIARGLGVAEEVLSPTFILFEEYGGRLPLVHIDLYRLDHERELEDLGVFERLDGTAVVVAEWGERSERILEWSDLVIHLKITGDTSRRIELSSTPELAGWLETIET